MKSFLGINKEGILEIEGVSSVELAKRYKTPLYVFSEKSIRDNYRRVSKAFKSLYPNTEIAYAYKACPLMAVCKILKGEGALAEVLSMGELHIASLVGYSGSRIIFNGNNKSRESLRAALTTGALINVDSLHELKMLQDEASQQDRTARISIRVNPVVPAETIEEWETALENSKFGVSMFADAACDAYKEAMKQGHMDIIGIHSHIGSQVEKVEPYRTATERILEFVGKLKKDLGLKLQVVNLGGGFPIEFDYRGGEIPPIEEYAEAVMTTVRKKTDEFDLGEPKIVFEPGGSIVGSSALLLLSVGTIKKRRDGKKLVAVDGGANVNLRATQGWYNYQFVCCNKMNQEKDRETFDIVGPLCYAGDVLGRDKDLPTLEEGDIVAAMECGAYTVAVMNRYNSYPLPAVVLVNDGDAEVIKRAETLNDLVSAETVPCRLLGD